ncbi:MAG: hypothetical protein JW974_01505 [Alphaproteobacteria bacterium]|jgi:glutaredoxin|nr:hypothetical protein [Alphaproteobacteria bacterium]MBN2675458.1 hypothetical protein [Alphaproteobacteria bacterium]
MKLSLLSLIGTLFFVGTASAADITVYHSPTCPHCHHALNFISGELVYEYKTINVEAVNVMNEQNLPAFQSALEKCKFTEGGVPLIIVGEKCFQGYARALDQELRDAAAVGLSKQEKADAEANIKAFKENSEKFKAENSDRNNVVKDIDAAMQKKTNDSSSMYFIILLSALVVGLGFMLIRKERKK